MAIPYNPLALPLGAFTALCTQTLSSSPQLLANHHRRRHTCCPYTTSHLNAARNAPSPSLFNLRPHHAPHKPASLARLHKLRDELCLCLTVLLVRWRPLVHILRIKRAHVHSKNLLCQLRAAKHLTPAVLAELAVERGPAVGRGVVVDLDLVLPGDDVYLLYGVRSATNLLKKTSDAYSSRVDARSCHGSSAALAAVVAVA